MNMPSSAVSYDTSEDRSSRGESTSLQRSKKYQVCAYLDLCAISNIDSGNTSEADCEWLSRYHRLWVNSHSCHFNDRVALTDCILRSSGCAENSSCCAQHECCLHLSSYLLSTPAKANKPYFRVTQI
jgi:hypothetical protein